MSKIHFCVVFIEQTPGPGAYATVGIGVFKLRPPIYSLTGKNYPPDDKTMKPGPGAHENEKVYVDRN
jgi:Sperm-tail PG-rich repeat